jgi:hypothetical protein
MSDRSLDNESNIEIPARGRPRKRDVLNLDIDSQIYTQPKYYDQSYAYNGIDPYSRRLDNFNEYYSKDGPPPRRDTFPNRGVEIKHVPEYSRDGYFNGEDPNMCERAMGYHQPFPYFNPHTDYNAQAQGELRQFKSEHIQNDQPFNNAGYSPYPTRQQPNLQSAFGNEHLLQGNSWMNRKKRKNNPLLWQYIKNHQDFYPGLIHPSKYSSLDFIQGVDKSQKMYLGTIKRVPQFVEKNNTNTILPLYLNSTTNYESSIHVQEFQKVAANFLHKTKDIDYENVTVQQLKSLMEFGLSHAGKKMDLIERVKGTQQKLLEKRRMETSPHATQPSFIENKMEKEQLQDTKKDNCTIHEMSLNDDQKDMNFLFF